MTNRSRSDSSTKTCTADECERPLRARELCAYHWRLAYGKVKTTQVKCPTCGAETTKRADGASTRRFCSLTCRDVWRIEADSNPAPPTRRTKRVSRLPVGHPVRVLIRAKATAKTPLREAFEAEDWAAVGALLRAETVKVDECWLWPRTHGAKAYGRIMIGKRHFAVHRLSKAASEGGIIPSHTPVHHVCAEPLCINPAHLQLVTPHENTAEMMERRYYQERIADLEAALVAVAPNHPALDGCRIPPAA